MWALCRCTWVLLVVVATHNGASVNGASVMSTLTRSPASSPVPSHSPSTSPSAAPSVTPSAHPSDTPSTFPTPVPSPAPSQAPSTLPSSPAPTLADDDTGAGGGLSAGAIAGIVTSVLVAAGCGIALALWMKRVEGKGKFDESPMIREQDDLSKPGHASTPVDVEIVESERDIALDMDLAFLPTLIKHVHVFVLEPAAAVPASQSVRVVFATNNRVLSRQEMSDMSGTVSSGLILVDKRLGLKPPIIGERLEAMARHDPTGAALSDSSVLRKGVVLVSDYNATPESRVWDKVAVIELFAEFARTGVVAHHIILPETSAIRAFYKGGQPIQPRETLPMFVKHGLPTSHAMHELTCVVDTRRA